MKKESPGIYIPEDAVEELVSTPTPKDEHWRLAETYKDEGAKKAPLSRKQAALIKRKEKEKIQQEIKALKDRINKRLAEDKEKAFHERIKKILN